MTPSPGLLMTLIVILGAGLALLTLLLAVTWHRLGTVAAVLHGVTPPAEVVAVLMGRVMKPELHGLG